MNERQQTLSRALAKHPAFKWQRGMSMLRDAHGKADNLRLEHVCHGKVFNDAQRYSALWSESIPDLCDPATVGALAGLMRSIATSTQADVILTCQKDEDGWFIESIQAWHRWESYPTEGEAWANLLLSVKP